jgi:hypothetical protein
VNGKLSHVVATEATRQCSSQEDLWRDILDRASAPTPNGLAVPMDILKIPNGTTVTIL